MPICPVPPDQLPINEYQDLEQSWFFHWSTLDWQTYALRVCSIWSAAWVLSGPVAAASFKPQDYPARFSLLGALGASFILGLVLLRLFLGWNYIRRRLLNQTVVYEETGWYDGGCWEKPPEEQTKDRLIGTYQVGPVLQRLRWSLLSLVGFALADGLAWLCLPQA